MINGYMVKSIINKNPEFLYEIKDCIEKFSTVRYSDELISGKYRFVYYAEPETIYIEDRLTLDWAIEMDEQKIKLFYNKKLKGNKPSMAELLGGITEEICKYQYFA